MAVNPDNFIFHSDFWYPYDYISGSLPVTSASIPADFTLSNEYSDGDMYLVFKEFTSGGTTYINAGGLSDTFYPNTSGNTLSIFQGAQSAGATFTGTFHYRIYKKPDPFTFYPKYKMEKQATKFEGSFSWQYGAGSTGITLPDDSEKMFFVGMYRINGGPWQTTLSQLSNNGILLLTYTDDGTTKQVTLNAFTDGSQTDYTLDYKIVGVLIDPPDDPFIFKSDEYPFAITQNLTFITGTGTSIGGNSTVDIYSDWQDIYGSKIGFVPIFKDGTTTVENYVEYQLVTNKVTAIPYVETSTDGKQIRVHIKITNSDASAQSFTNKNIIAYVYVFQVNNA